MGKIAPITLAGYTRAATVLRRCCEVLQTWILLVKSGTRSGDVLLFTNNTDYTSVTKHKSPDSHWALTDTASEL